MKNNLFATSASITTPITAGATADMPKPASASQNDNEADHVHDTTHRLFELSRMAQVSLRDAIAVAESRHDGSAHECRSASTVGFPPLSGEDGRNDLIWENTIDAKTGRITGVERDPFQKRSTEDLRNIKALKHVTQEMSEAVLIAEIIVSGMAIAGCLADDCVTLSFVVLVVSGDRLKQVILEVDRQATASRGSAF